MQLEEKGKEMTDKLKGAIDELNQEASALEVEKEKKEVSACHGVSTFMWQVALQAGHSQPFNVAHCTRFLATLRLVCLSIQQFAGCTSV